MRNGIPLPWRLAVESMCARCPEGGRWRHILSLAVCLRARPLSLSSWAAARSLARSLPHWLSREYRTRRRQWEIGRRFTRALDRKRAIERLRLTHTHTRSPVREFGRMRRNQEAPLAERRRKFHWLSLFIDWFFFLRVIGALVKRHLATICTNFR